MSHHPSHSPDINGRPAGFYDRPTVDVDADLDQEEADLVDDCWAAEEAATERRGATS